MLQARPVAVAASRFQEELFSGGEVERIGLNYLQGSMTDTADETLTIGNSDRPITVKHLPGKGRGVIATREITTGESIDQVPVLLIPANDRPSVDKSIIFTYVFMWEHGTTEQDLYDGWGRAAIALGLISLLNHSYTPNAEFIRHIDELEIELRALRPIAAGEEVTIDYQMDLWFDPV